MKSIVQILTSFIAASAFALVGCSKATPEKALENEVRSLTNAWRGLEAIEKFNSRSSDITPTPRTLSYVSLAYYNEDDIANCHKFADQATDLNDEDELAAMLYILTSGKLKKFEKAHSIAQKWLKKPEAEDIIQQIIIFYNDTESYEHALEASSVGLKRLPKDDTIAGTHAHTLAMIKGRDAMLGFVQTWTSRNRPTAYFWENVGRGLYRLEQYDEAVTYFNKSLSIDQEQADVVQLIAESLQHGTHDLEQLAKIAEWSKNRPDSAKLQNQIAVVYYLGGDKEKALEHIENAYKLEPTNAQYIKNRNTVLGSFKQADQN
ncbi:tetratricopeptide repeat protein [Pelagicoccus mobilis]|uniref:Tetratricopeptide repeat protein n=1 Tax=Pelagicoccus mobilis TaxID=415221 RepID=A0A934RZW8_9BACT|nr:tetratricopeptide repeat protein [Pelagicoccus mobilis]MBK1877966.1 tetratricopeptide repeat protein [Pelagicoccus mobilis]